MPRRNRLARPKANDPTTLQVTAANIDTLVIVVATKDPPLRLGLIDRFLAAAERQGMEALIVVNKCDLVDQDKIAPEDYLKYLTEQLRGLDFAPIVFISANSPRRSCRFRAVTRPSPALASTTPSPPNKWNMAM